MNRLLERFVEFLIAWRWALFALAMVLAAAAYWPATRVRFDHSIEKMFAKSDPVLAPYLRLKERFGGNEVVMVVYHDDDLLAPAGQGIERLAAISERMKKVHGVRDVLSLAQVNTLLEQLKKGKRLGELFNLFDKRGAWTGPEILNPESPLAARYRELFAGYTHSADGKTAAVVCMLEPGTGRAATIASLEETMNDLPDGLSPGVLAGEPVLVEEGFSLLEKDGQRLGTWTLALMGLTVLVLFRDPRWLVAAVVVVLWSLVITRASIAISGFELSMVSSMLTAMITVVGVAGVMHLIVEVRELGRGNLTPRDALKTVGVLLAGPILGAVMTDVSGFASLWWASVEPVRDFGTMMVVGSFLVLPALCLTVPAISLVGRRNRPRHAAWEEVHLGYWLMRSVDAVHGRPRTVAICAVIISIIASLGAVRLEVETDFTRNFRRGSRIVRAYEFVETNLGGAGVWDIVLPAPNALDEKYLARVRGLEERLRKIELRDLKSGRSEPGLTKVISLVDALDAVDVDPALALLTPTPELRYRGFAAAMPSFMAALRSTENDEHGEGRLRIMLRARERQRAEQKQWLIGEVTRLVREEFPASETSAGAEVTGFFVLLTNLIESILRDQWTTFAVSSIAIAAMVWAGYRSWRYALIAMIPNAVPIYIVMGLLGWLGFKMNMGAAMIAAISMGMSVDSSIHYFSAFRHARREGKSVHAALAQCQQSVGLAMIFTTVALTIGFSVLMTSQFVPTIYFGALMSLAMLGGMLGNLIVLPLLLSWTERDATP